MTPALGAEAQALFLEGWGLHQKGDLDGARARYEAALARAPQHVHALHALGIIATQLNDFTTAMDWLDKALALDPTNALAHFNRGVAAEKLSRPAEAYASFGKAAALKPGYADAHHHRALAALALAQMPEAIADFDAALTINPDLADAWLERGIALWRLGRLDEAVASYDRTLALRPDMAEAHINRGAALRDLGRLPEALVSLNEAIRLNPTHAGAYNNRGTVLLEQGDNTAALASFEVAVGLQPENVKAMCNRAVAMDVLQRHDAALGIFEAVLRLDPTYAKAYFNRGMCLKKLRRYDDAIADLQKAMELDPATPNLRGILANIKMLACDWSNFDADVAAISKGVLAGERVSPPLEVIAMADSLTLQRRAAEIWVQDKCPVAATLPVRPKPDGKIRVGYFSPDFRQHPVSYLTAELFEKHDRTRFEIVAYALDPPVEDAMRTRLRAAFDTFVEAHAMSDDEIVRHARTLEIDIAVDLAGYTADARPRVFALRAAPVQVNYLGFPGTMGAAFMDYIIADAVAIPPASQAQYTEKIIYLPCFQPNDTAREAAGPTPARAAVGLPERGVVFCGFNNVVKINPPGFDSWMRILRQTEGSVLWLSAQNTTTVRNLRQEAARRGIDPARLVFASRVPTLAEHFARHACADLFLDLLPYNAHTTASDALWAGLPVLTCAGESYAARAAASLLNAIGLPELITTRREDYETLAVELAHAPERILALKNKLAQNRKTTALFDIAAFTRALEEGYTKIHARMCDGLLPEHVTIAP